MLYRKFGKTNYMLSALGVGTNRFCVNTAEDIQKSEEVVYNALKNGVNYIDVAYNYSKGCAYKILQKAFERAEKDGLEYHVTVKSAYKTDKTADAAYQRVLFSLKEMNIKRATFFVCWGISSYEEYQEIIQSGGMYDGALRAKKEGLIDSICFSTHAPVEDIVRILEDEKFDGVTISYSALNYKQYIEVLQCARKHNIGVITMNSLGGGIIPQNKEFFNFLRLHSDETVEEAALKFVYAHDEITCCLSGMSSLEELQENLFAFSDNDCISERLTKVDSAFGELSEYCSGCNYCAGCPADIPIRELMQSLNGLHFPFKEGSYNRVDRELLNNISVTKKLNKDFFYMPGDTRNPCIHCGMCETKCTQHLPIQSKIVSLYKVFEQTGYSKTAQKNRLKQLLYGNNYKKVGFIPGGGMLLMYCDCIKNFLVNRNLRYFSLIIMKNYGVHLIME